MAHAHSRETIACQCGSHHRATQYGANTATVPYTGVPLPFISFGGSSVVVSLSAVGILLNISRYIQEPEMPALVRYTVNLRKKKQV